MPRRYHSVVLCACARDALCNRCRETLFAQLKGTAACRGEAWADNVRRHVDGAPVWPAHEGRAADLARQKVIDLARDPQLRERLAAELAKWAARRWGTSSTLTPPAG